MDLKPKEGMEFDNIEAAWKLWVDYSKMIGFGPRKQYINRRKKDDTITSCRFVCCKEGLRKIDKRDYQTVNHRQETRTDCKARISLIHINGKLRIHEFVEDHNHELQLKETIHMLASHRKLSEVQAQEIDLADESGLHLRDSFQLMSRCVGGRENLGYTRLDHKNYLRTKRQRSLMYGEAGCLMQYFQRQLLENMSFFYTYQMDLEEQITNVFWADAKMLIDYEYFGDVISVDTTYCTNRAHRPLALFSGFNHYRGAVIFGAALMYDETTESFKWLFETFLEAHKQKKPQTIFTDQDQAMAKALREVMPDTCHGLCTWHLMQNGIKHLGNLMKNDSYFLRDFKACMYKYVEEIEFEGAWSNLLSTYNVQENSWLKSIYKIKEKWAACYMKKKFMLGIRSTQISESVNSSFKSFMSPSLNINQFFKHFERVVDEKWYNELRCEFEARHKVLRMKSHYSPMLRQVAKLYTHTMFDLFQEEFDIHLAACVKSKSEKNLVSEYIISIVDRFGEWKVSLNHCDKLISCSCRKFETFGMLCCHALKVFDVTDVKLVPDQYILKRWTKQARDGHVYDVKGNEIQGDAKLATTQRYRDICP